MIRLYRNISELLTMNGVEKKCGRHISEEDLGLIEKGCVAVLGEGKSSRLLWCGPDKDLPRKFALSRKSRDVLEISCQGQVVLPGLVECHTHLVFSGSRSEEFEMRLKGASYAEISARGGGILSTVRATRDDSVSKLIQKGKERMDRFYEQGVRVLEIKSGYGLSLQQETKILEVITKLSKYRMDRVVRTFLGAHAKGPEFATHDEYLKHLSEKVLPALVKKNLIDRVDIFVEKGFFEESIARDYLKRAQKLGLARTVHADQLSLSGGSDLAYELEAQSADHMICVGQEQIAKFAHDKAPVAVCLPTADLYLKCPYPPARKLLDQGACVALATDFNPGTSPCLDIALVGLLARLQMNMRLHEVVAAYTWNAAKALGLQDSWGSLVPGKKGSLARYEGGYRDLFYSPGTMKSLTE